MVACAASATAPSMQPPLTDPAMRPDAVTAIWLPAGRRGTAPGLRHRGQRTFSPCCSHSAATDKNVFDFGHDHSPERA